MKLRGLPQDDLYWEVTAHGAIAVQFASSELVCQVTFAQLLPCDGYFHFAGPVIERQVGIGYLVNVPLGSRWRNGAPVPPLKPAARRTWNIPPNSTLQSVALGRLEARPLSEDRGQHAIEPTPLGDGMNSRCYLLQASGKVPVIIPQIELRRALFGATSRLLKVAFKNRRTFTIPLFRRRLTDRMPKVEGEVTIFPLVDLEKSELPAIVNVLTDPSMGEFFRSFAKLDFSEPFHPDAKWGFTSELQIKAQSRLVMTRIANRATLASLITHMHSVTCPNPIEHVHLIYADPLYRRSKGRPGPTGSRRGPEPDEVEPGADANFDEPVRSDTAAEIEVPFEVEVERRRYEAGERAIYRRRGKPPKAEIPLVLGTTADAGDAAGPRPVELGAFDDDKEEDTPAPVPLSKTLADTDDALRQLAADYGLNYRKLTAKKPGFMGLHALPPSSKRSERWSNIDGRPRVVYVASLSNSGWTVVVFDVETRPDSEEHFALGMLNLAVDDSMLDGLTGSWLKALSMKRGVFMKTSISPRARLVRRPEWDVQTYAAAIGRIMSDELRVLLA